MAMSKGVGMGSIVVGCSLLVLTLISVICGAVTVNKITAQAEAAASVGLWSLYFLIPGSLSVAAGFKKLKALTCCRVGWPIDILAVALGTHILGLIIAIVGMIYAALLWTVLAALTTCGDGSISILTKDDRCVCDLDGTRRIVEAKCDDLDAIRSSMAAVTIVYVLIAIFSLTGSIYGCVGTCCAPQEPASVVVTSGHQPGTVVMSKY